MGEITESNYQKIKTLFEQGEFKNVINLSRSLGAEASKNVSIVKLELVSLLSIGRERQALRLFKKYKLRLDFGKEFKSLFKRFVRRDSLSHQVDQVIKSNREILGVYFSKKSPSWYVSKISTYQNIILISNSSAFSLSDDEKLLLRSLPKSLFVYLNIGNPSIADIRDQIYGPDAAELLIGGHHHVVDSASNLIFVPYKKSHFLGCLVRVNSRFQRLWYESLKIKADEANLGINFSELEEALLIDSLYPLSTFRDSNNGFRKRIPSIGWMATTFLDAVIESRCDAESRLWLAGFSLTPTYIFHVAGNLQQHDFSFEKKALDRRFSQKKVSLLGSVSCESREMNAEQHLYEYGFRGQQLSQYLRLKGLI